jgi:hypothetical protein
MSWIKIPLTAGVLAENAVHKLVDKLINSLTIQDPILLEIKPDRCVDLPKEACCVPLPAGTSLSTGVKGSRPISHPSILTT